MNIEYIQKQANGQVKWGDTRTELAVWLKSKHSIEGELANEIIEKAFLAKRADIRSTAKVHFTIYFIVSLALGGMLGLMLMTDARIGLGKGMLLVGLLSCLGLTGKSFMRMLTGEGDHRADFVDQD